VTVAIPSAVRRAIVAHARRDRPHECCGLLIGRGRRIDFAYPMANIAARPATRYRVDDAAHLELRRVLRQLTPPLAIVGVYHSHPSGPARPSERDVREAHYPDWMHVIVGFHGRRALIYACHMRGRRVTALRIVPRLATGDRRRPRRAPRGGRS
jgi:proteasome lid subunit RPN8/RPN11